MRWIYPSLKWLAAVLMTAGALGLVFWTRSFADWNEFVAYSNKWGNVVGVISFPITIFGFLITFCGFLYTIAQQDRLRQALKAALERAAGSHLNNNAAEAERLLLAFKSALEDADWRHARQRCDEVVIQLIRMQANPYLLGEERMTLAPFTDDLRELSRYIMDKKILKDPPNKTFEADRLEVVDRVLHLVGGVAARLQRKVWEE